ncbi:MAG: M15 family metallopeptidase [Clostridiales bacterium]|nr:M15 family metallopeptidase [Clostridiales bacterium]
MDNGRREARSKRKARQMRQRRMQTVVGIALAVLIVLALRALFFTADRRAGSAEEDPGISSVGAEDAQEAPGMVNEDDGFGEDLPEAILPEEPEELMPGYYDEALLGRYEAFSALHPELSEEDVYWMVGCDLDKPGYEDIRPVADPESLLVLVNKHFYLPQDYTPPDLINVGNTQMRAEAGEAVLEMISAAAAEGHNLWSQSGYRSYGVQSNLFSQYSARDGEAVAETYSARPGHSEHQTGLATDLNTITDAFGGTPEGIWAAENCWRFGLIVRYTNENTDIVLYRPEPWHIRYIGVEAAKRMHDEGIISFEEYWVKYVSHPLG